MVPNAHQLLDICECRCFEDLDTKHFKDSDAKHIHPDSCACETEEGIRKDPWSVTEGSLDFYVDQCTTRRRTAVLDCGRCHLEAQEGDAEAAAEEDAAMESAAGEEDGPDLAERQAQVHFEEDQLFAAEEAPEVSHNNSFDTLPGSPQGVMHEEDDGVEENEK